MRVEKLLYNNGTSRMILVNESYEIIEEVLLFSNYLYTAGYSPNSIDGYLRDIKKFYQFLQTKNNMDFKLVKPIDIIEFIQELTNSNGNQLVLNPATINRKLAGIASFYKYHEKITGVVAKSPFITLAGQRSADMARGLLFHTGNKTMTTRNYIKQRRTKVLIKRLNKEQVEKASKGFKNQHMSLIYKLLYYSGMRIGELLGLRVIDYEMPGSNDRVGAIYILSRKSNECHQRQKTGDRVVHIPKEILVELDEYVTMQRPYVQEIDHIFVAIKGKTKGYPLTRDAIEKAFRKCAKEIGIKFTPHYLRHTHFTELAEAGFDEQFIKARGGWSSINSAARYIHPSIEAQRKAFERYLERSK